MSAHFPRSNFQMPYRTNVTAHHKWHTSASRWVRDDAGLVLSLKLNMENLSFSFSKNDLQSERALFVEILQIYMHYDFVR